MKRIRVNFRKIVSIVLIIALFSTGCVFADSTESSRNTIKQDGSTSCPIPTYDYSDEISYVLKPNDNNGFSISGDNEGISVSKYQLFDGIYSDGNNQFFQKVGADEFVRVNRNVIKLKDPDLRTKLSDHFDNIEIINDIMKKAQMCSNSDAEVILFTEPGSGRGYWTTTTWNGQTFHHYVVDIQEYWTPYKTLASGTSTTYNYLNGLVNFTLSVAGVFSQIASVFGTGLSALQFFGAPVEYCHQDNYIQAAVKGNWYTKYTYYYYLGVDQYACISHLIDFTKIDTVEFFISSGTGIRKHNEAQFVKTCYSPFYSNPESMAYSVIHNGLDVYNDSVSLKVQAGSYYKYYYFQ